MKKIVVLLFVAFAAVSCLDKGSYSQSYMADITFEFSDPVYTSSFKDSLYVLKSGEGDGFLYMQYPLLFSQKTMNGVFQGGFLMSCLKGGKDGALSDEPKDNDAYRVNAPSGFDTELTFKKLEDVCRLLQQSGGINDASS